MHTDIANKISEILKSRYGDILYVVNYGYYLWVWSKMDGFRDSRLILVIHGYGTKERPYEIKLIGVDKGKTINIRFSSLKKMIKYIKEDLIMDFMIYSL